MTTLNVKAIRFDGYKIELRTNIKGKPVAELSKYMTAGKNKGNYKRLECFYFATEERRAEWCKEKMSNIKANLSHDKEEKAKLREIKDAFINPFKVGDIYYDSWGYDQTNIDFYKIIEVKDRSVVIRAIGAIMCPYGQESGMSSNVRPDPNNFIGEAITKIIQIRIWSGKTNVFIKSPHRGWITKYADGEKGVYSSWYA